MFFVFVFVVVFALFVFALLLFCFYLFILFYVIVQEHCYSQPCLNNGSCVNSADGYQCACVTGFQGQNCQGEGINLLFVSH